MSEAPEGDRAPLFIAAGFLVSFGILLWVMYFVIKEPLGGRHVLLAAAISSTLFASETYKWLKRRKS